MISTAKSKTTFGIESREVAGREVRKVLEKTQKDIITRDDIVRDLCQTPVKRYQEKSTPPELVRIRRMVSYAMTEICATDGTWIFVGSRHNPRWFRVKSS